MKKFSRHSRKNTWTDEALEAIYDINSMSEDKATKTKHLLDVLQVIRRCNRATDLNDAITLIIESTCHLLECDRATLFMVDTIQEELVIRQAVGVKDIRIPWDSGIAGQVFKLGSKLNIPDAYKDSRFSSAMDAQTGYETNSILCAPVQDANDVTVAVLQAINKIDPSTKKFVPFTKEDELLMDHLAMQVGIIVRNQILREDTIRSHEQVVALLEIVRSLHSNMGIASLMFTITERSPGLVDADRCTLYLVDRQHGELWSIQGAVEVRIPMDKGLSGYCATHAEIINIEDAHQDERFNTDYDKKTGYRTKSVLVMPIHSTMNEHSENDTVIGVLQLINKRHGEQFTKEDEQLLKSFLDIAGPILTTSQLFHSTQKKKSEFDIAADIVRPNLDSPRANLPGVPILSSQLSVASMAIEEVDEEDEEDGDE